MTKKKLLSNCTLQILQDLHLFSNGQSLTYTRIVVYILWKKERERERENEVTTPSACWVMEIRATQGKLPRWEQRPKIRLEDSPKNVFDVISFWHQGMNKRKLLLISPPPIALKRLWGVVLFQRKWVYWK